jgi:RNA polymerase sigma-70 factor, ECF subfamily
MDPLELPRPGASAPDGQYSEDSGALVDRVIRLPIAAIAQRIRSGDERTFDAVFRGYHPALVRFAFCYLRSNDAAQEIVADVFLKLWQTRAELRIVHSLESYLFCAVRNAALNRMRSMRREQRWIGEFLSQDLPPAMGVPPKSPENAAVERDEQARIWRAIDTLPERGRVILVLRWQRHLRFEEIAEVMDLSLWAVQQQHSRAIRALRRALPDLLR